MDSSAKRTISRTIHTITYRLIHNYKAVIPEKLKFIFPTDLRQNLKL